MIRVTLSNYRCFNRNRPARFEISTGLTSFVGPNNVGKTALLRSLYELRPVLANMIGYLPHSMSSTYTLSDVADPSEVFCNKNDGEVSVEVALPDEADMPLLKLSSQRSHPEQWNVNAKWPMQEIPGSLTVQARDRLNPLVRTLYVGPFRNILNVGEVAYHDLAVGTSFVRDWDKWKNGTSKGDSRNIRDVENDLKRIFGFDALAINPSEDRQTLQVFVNGEPYRLGEVGAGLSQFIVVFGAAATRHPDYIIIDEPELNLHPSLQIDFLLSLAKYSRCGVLFATHSIGLARSVSDRVYSLRATPDGTDLRPLDATRDYLEFAGELSFSAFRELGFKRLLLVEGVTEVKVFQQWLRCYGKEHQVVALPLGGSQMINGRVGAELAELKRITDCVSVIVDSERGSDAEPLARDREDFVTTCRSLGFDVHTTVGRATENYFTEDALKLAFGEPRRALGPYERLRDHPKPWSKVDNWRIASFMKMDAIDGTDLGPFLRSL